MEKIEQELNRKEIESGGLASPFQEAAVEVKKEDVGVKTGELSSSNIISAKEALAMIIKAKQEFPDSIRWLIERLARGQKISRADEAAFNKAREKWWREKFGTSFGQRNLFAEEIKRLIKTAEETNTQIGGDRYMVSEQEKLDSEMNAEKEGWSDYWTKRLLPELDILPKSMQVVVRKLAAGKELLSAEMNQFVNYVNRRAKIKGLEIKKREAMGKLKKELRDIDERKNLSPEETHGRRAVYYDKNSESLFVLDENGTKKMVSVGDLVGDYNWGIKYKVDDSLPDNLWREIRKTLSLYETRQEIMEIWDEELHYNYHTALPVSRQMGLDFLEKKITSLEFMSQSPSVRGGITGALAERMVTGFLTRIQYNNPDLGFSVEQSNALEDTILKYDFKIYLNKLRGVSLESKDVNRRQFVRNKKRFGVQFTISQHVSEKRKQIKIAKGQLAQYKNLIKKKVDNIVLVKMPVLQTFGDSYYRWLNEGKPSGGPEQYLTRKQKLSIFKQATKGLLNLSQEELKNLKL